MTAWIENLSLDQVFAQSVKLVLIWRALSGFECRHADIYLVMW